MMPRDPVVHLLVRAGLDGGQGPVDFLACGDKSPGRRSSDRYGEVTCPACSKVIGRVFLSLVKGVG